MRRNFLAAAALALACATAAPAAAQDAGKVQIVRGSSVEVVTPGSRRAQPVVLRGTPPAPEKEDDMRVPPQVNIVINNGIADSGLFDVGLANERFRDRRRSRHAASQGVSFFPPSVFGPNPRPTRQRGRLR